MKKIILLFLLFSVLGFCFAEGTVCLVPANAEIKQYLTVFLTGADKIKEYNPSFDSELLRSGDSRLLEYVSSLNEADFYLIPLVRELSGIKYMTVSVYKDGTFSKIFEVLDSKSNSFEPEVLLKLYPYFSDEKFALLKLEDFVSGTYVLVDGKKFPMLNNAMLIPEGEHLIEFSSIGYTSEQRTVNLVADTVNTLSVSLEMPMYHNLSVESIPQAKVFIDGEEVGETPFLISDYSLPLTLRLQAEGYTDRVVSVTEPQDVISVNLRSVAMGDVNLFKKTQSKFYWSFTRTLLLFGGMAATKGVNRFTKSAQKGINYGFYGAIGLSLVDMGFKLYRYFNGIRDIAP